MDVTTLAQYFAAFSAGVAAVLAFLDRREKNLRDQIEKGTNEKIRGLEERVTRLESKHQKVRELAVKGLTTAPDPDTKGLFAEILTVLD
jgi:hypothetical protein